MPKTKHKNPLTYETKSGVLLTEKETTFVHMMVGTRGNRIESVVEAYNIDTSKKRWKRVASEMAYENLTRPHILEAINELFSEAGLTDQVADRELQYVIEQKAELSPKVKAISEYNRLTGRHAPEEQTILVETLEERIKRKKDGRNRSNSG